MLVAAGVDKFAGEGFPEVAAPDGEDERGAEEKDGVEAGAAFAGPIELVFQVEPEGEFVESERGADAVEQRHQAAGEERSAASAGADFHDPCETHAQEDDDAPDKMVDVGAANDDVMKGADIVRGGQRGDARERDSGEETAGSEEQTAFGAVADVFMKEPADAGAVQDQENKGGGEENRDDKEPEIILHEWKRSGRRKYSLRRKIFGDAPTGESKRQMGEGRPGRATAAVE